MTGARIVAKAQYIKDLSFEVPRAPAIFRELRLPPAVQVRLEVQSGPPLPGDGAVEVTLKIHAEGRGAAPAPGELEFIAELSYCGLFDLGAVPAEDVAEALAVECPQILYPFACAIFADLSRDANFAPIQLDAVDFAQLWRQRSSVGDAG